MFSEVSSSWLDQFELVLAGSNGVSDSCGSSMMFFSCFGSDISRSSSSWPSKAWGFVGASAVLYFCSSFRCFSACCSENVLRLMPFAESTAAALAELLDSPGFCGFLLKQSSLSIDELRRGLGELSILLICRELSSNSDAAWPAAAFLPLPAPAIFFSSV